MAYRMPKFAIYVQSDTSDRISPDRAGALAGRLQYAHQDAWYDVMARARHCEG